MALKLNGSTDGSVSIDAPADTSPTGTDVTLTLPTSAGSSGQYLQTNGSGGLSWQTVTDTTTNLTRMTSVATTSGTAIDFAIPSNVRKIIVIFDQVSLNADQSLRVQIGTGGSPLTSGYIGRCNYQSSGSASEANYSGGFDIRHYDNRFDCTGTMTISNITGNTWISTHSMSSSGWSTIYMGSGVASLSGELDLIRVTATSGGTFDNGQVNVMYEV